MVWGLRIDGLPVHAAVTAWDGDLLSLAPVRMLSRPVPLALFHARDGLVYGLPAELLRAAGGESPNLSGFEPSVSRMSFGDLFGNTARQLGNVVAEAGSGLTLTAASVTLRGVPTASNEAVGLEFPSPEAVGSGAGLSELSFSLRPRSALGDAYVPSGPAAPDLVGYTRDLALRKVAAGGLVAEVSNEIVGDPGLAGRVTRQVPRAGDAVQPGQVLRLFIGKNDKG
jgi:hypothetical protein